MVDSYQYIIVTAGRLGLIYTYARRYWALPLRPAEARHRLAVADANGRVEWREMRAGQIILANRSFS